MTRPLAANPGVARAVRVEIGSIGKSFTAIVALQLEREGLVDLQAPVTDLLPWFRVRGDASEISLHHLLLHELKDSQLWEELEMQAPPNLNQAKY